MRNRRNPHDSIYPSHSLARAIGAASTMANVTQASNISFIPALSVSNSGILISAGFIKSALFDSRADNLVNLFLWMHRSKE